MADLEKLETFFNGYEPFSKTAQIRSILSGIVGSDTVNCYEAYEERKNL